LCRTVRAVRAIQVIESLLNHFLRFGLLHVAKKLVAIERGKRAHETTLFGASLRLGISMKFALESTMQFEISWDCRMQKTL
jgi:hypothetical protein